MPGGAAAPEPAASPAHRWKGPAPLSYRAKELAPGPAAGRSHALAGSRRGEGPPPDPRHGSASGGGRVPAALRASRQHQLVIVLVRR